MRSVVSLGSMVIVGVTDSHKSSITLVFCDSNKREVSPWSVSESSLVSQKSIQ